MVLADILLYQRFPLILVLQIKTALVSLILVHRNRWWVPQAVQEHLPVGLGTLAFNNKLPGLPGFVQPFLNCVELVAVKQNPDPQTGL